jgi:hypothetical protein
MYACEKVVGPGSVCDMNRQLKRNVLTEEKVQDIQA